MTHLPENCSVVPSVTQQRITCSSRPSYGSQRPESNFSHFFFFIDYIQKLY